MPAVSSYKNGKFGNTSNNSKALNFGIDTILSSNVGPTDSKTITSEKSSRKQSNPPHDFSVEVNATVLPIQTKKLSSNWGNILPTRYEDKGVTVNNEEISGTSNFYGDLMPHNNLTTSERTWPRICENSFFDKLHSSQNKFISLPTTCDQPGGDNSSGRSFSPVNQQSRISCDISRASSHVTPEAHDPDNTTELCAKLESKVSKQTNNVLCYSPFKLNFHFEHQLTPSQTETHLLPSAVTSASRSTHLLCPLVCDTPPISTISALSDNNHNTPIKHLTPHFCPLSCSKPRHSVPCDVPCKTILDDLNLKVIRDHYNQSFATTYGSKFDLINDVNRISHQSLPSFPTPEGSTYPGLDIHGGTSLPSISTYRDIHHLHKHARFYEHIDDDQKTRSKVAQFYYDTAQTSPFWQNNRNDVSIFQRSWREMNIQNTQTSPNTNLDRLNHQQLRSKRKKPRTSFTRIQIVELEKRFHRQKYLASSERSSLAKHVKMTDAQVKTWFQNRRTKWRRQTAEERDAERQAATRVMLSLQQVDTNSNNKEGHTDDVDPLCLSNSSLQALQNLKPWSEKDDSQSDICDRKIDRETQS